jgi:hypothetical protein
VTAIHSHLGKVNQSIRGKEEQEQEQEEGEETEGGTIPWFYAEGNPFQ